MNKIEVFQDRYDRLPISANVDEVELALLREMLSKYDEILTLFNTPAVIEE